MLLTLPNSPYAYLLSPRRRQQHKEKREQKSLEQSNAKASETLIKPDSENSTIFYPREAGNYQGPAGANPSGWRDVERISDTQGTSPRGPDDPQSFKWQDAPSARRHCDGDVRCLGDHMSQNYHAFSRVAQGTVQQQVPPDQSTERFPRQPFYHEPPMPAQYDLEAQAYKRAVAATLQRGLEDLADIAPMDTEALWQIVGHVVTSLKTERRRWDRAAELQERQIAAAWSMAAALGAAGHHQQQPYNRHREGGQGSGGRNVTTSPRDHIQHPSHLRQAPYPMSGPGAARPQGPNLGVNSAYYGHPWAIASRPGPNS